MSFPFGSHFSYLNFHFLNSEKGNKNENIVENLILTDASDAKIFEIPLMYLLFVIELLHFISTLNISHKKGLSSHEEGNAKHFGILNI